LREHCPLVVRGNHDRASTGQDDLEWFNPVARAAAVLDARESHAGYRAIRTRSAAGPLTVDGFEVVHGAPFDEDEYVVGAPEAEQALVTWDRASLLRAYAPAGGFIWNQSRVRRSCGCPGYRRSFTLDI